MHNRKAASSAVTLIAAFVIVAASVTYLAIGRPPEQIPRLAAAGIFVYFVVAVAVMVAALRYSCTVTLYSYRNIRLIGGILFTAVLTVISFVYFTVFNRETLTLPDVFQTLLRFPRHFSYYALFVMIALSLLVGVSNIALIRHEGLCLNNALSLIFAVVFVGGTLAVLFVADLLTERVLIPNGLTENPLLVTLCTAIPTFLLLMLCYFECITLGIALLGWRAVRRKAAYDKDFIIILGCSIDKRGGLLPLLKGRVNSAVRFAWEQERASGKPVRYVPSGGQGPNEIMSEGSAMELYLRTHGAEDGEVFPEKKSVNTRENLRFSSQIIDGLQPDAKIAFATTNYHVLRSGILAQQLGIPAEGISAPTKWYFWPNGFLREVFALLVLDRRTHFTVAGITAAFCAVIGCAGYFAGLL